MAEKLPLKADTTNGIIRDFETGDFIGVSVGGTGADLSSGAASNYLRGNAAGTALEYRTPAQVLGDIGAQPLDATLTALAGLALDNFSFPTEVVAGGRLTAVSGNAVPTSDQTGVGTLCYTGFVSNRITLFNGVDLKNYEIPAGDVSLSLTGLLTNAKPHDIFIHDENGTLTLSVLAWTNDSTRAEALEKLEICPFLTKLNDPSKRWLGILYATGTGTFEDSAANRFLLNAFNAVPRQLYASYTGASSWSYGTATWRRPNDAAASAGQNQVKFLSDGIRPIPACRSQLYATTTYFEGAAGMAMDWTSGATGARQMIGDSRYVPLQIAHVWTPQTAGMHTLDMIELGIATNPVLFFGNSGAGQDHYCSLSAEVWA